VAEHARVMIVGTALSRFTGFLRVVALGYALGFGRLSDAYTLANTTPNILFDLVVGGVLAGTLVPVFVRAVRAHDRGEQDWEAVSAIFTVVAVALVVVTVGFLLLVPVLIRLYTVGLHDRASLAERLARDLLYLFVPQVALYGAVTLMTALLNARRRFAAPAFAPVLNNLVVIAVVLAVPHLAHHRHPNVDQVLHSNPARLVLGFGTTAGVAAMAVAMIPALLAAGPHLRWRWDPRHQAIRTLLGLAGWTAGAVIAGQVAFFVVSALANHRSGGYTAYSYAYTFFVLPHGIFAVSVMSALEPELSTRWFDRDVPGFRRELVAAIRLVAAFVVPAALGYAVLGRPVVRLLLEHGSFTAAGARTTADVLALMALGLPVYSLFLVLMRAYQAVQDTRTMFVMFLVENVVNLALAFALYPAFGVQGLAVALGLGYAAGCAAALRDLRRKLGGLQDGRLGTALYRITVAAAISANAALLVGRNVLGHALGTAPGPILVVRVAAAVITGVTVYVRVTRYFGVDEVRSMLQLRRRATL
jgi:putative peptidoglycan lipid II flippase